ncbi:hypothetical protein PVK06_000561 [Gossypium arboreum]|uniref:RRM domain-containing protein n=1 Tax=Gossypium arboreum TaxID=29729 RepID=A0ABR0QYN0_GOSAR|nr:hypothetical protein PVK06_000561 [Gossypium arboreum]
MLDLSKNYFGGIIPSCLGNFSRGISIINLQKNSLNGKIPDFCVELSSLTTLALNDNKLEGLLPRSLVNCTLLRFLNLVNNTLNDLFPHRLSVLPELQVLILRSNRFYGRLDYSMATSSFLSLQILDLSKNEFTGPFPNKFFQSFRRMKLVAASQPHQKRGCDDADANCREGGYERFHNYKKIMKVIDAFIQQNRAKSARRFGFIRYESLRDVTRAIERLNGFRLYGHRIAISMAKLAVSFMVDARDKAGEIGFSMFQDWC